LFQYALVIARGDPDLTGRSAGEGESPLTPMALSPHPNVRDPRRLAVLALLAVLIGGIVGWTAASAGAMPWGLVLDAVVVIAVVAVLARHQRPPGTFATMLGWSLAFTLLTWPLLWLAVGLAR
jgi:hypothetical protein